MLLRLVYGFVLKCLQRVHVSGGRLLRASILQESQGRQDQKHCVLLEPPTLHLQVPYMHQFLAQSLSMPLPYSLSAFTRFV